MLLGRMCLEIAIGLQPDAVLGPLGGGSELLQVDVLVETEEDGRPGRGLHHVVRLVLRVLEPEGRMCVRQGRMALERQMPALERVEVVESDRERDAEAFGDLGTEDAAPSRLINSSNPTSTGCSSPSRIPLSGAISSYDQARFGASVSMPRRRRSH